jgi:hypothetical protein
MLALKEHSMSSFEQLLYDLQVITLVLEWLAVDVVAQALNDRYRLDVVPKSGDGYAESPPMACT